MERRREGNIYIGDGSKQIETLMVNQQQGGGKERGIIIWELWLEEEKT